jgi:hypothetical protein
MQFDWEDDFEIEVKVENNQVILWANKDGLISRGCKKVCVNGQ